MSMTGNIDRIEVITSGSASAALVGEREGGDRAGDLRAGHVGVVGRPPARGFAEPGLHLYAEGALSGGGPGRRSCRHLCHKSLSISCPQANHPGLRVLAYNSIRGPGDARSIAS